MSLRATEGSEAISQFPKNGRLLRLPRLGRAGVASLLAMTSRHSFGLYKAGFSCVEPEGFGISRFHNWGVTDQTISPRQTPNQSVASRISRVAAAAEA